MLSVNCYRINADSYLLGLFVSHPRLCIGALEAGVIIGNNLIFVICENICSRLSRTARACAACGCARSVIGSDARSVGGCNGLSVRICNSTRSVLNCARRAVIANVAGGIISIIRLTYVRSNTSRNLIKRNIPSRAADNNAKHDRNGYNKSFPASVHGFYTLP